MCHYIVLLSVRFELPFFGFVDTTIQISAIKILIQTRRARRVRTYQWHSFEMQMESGKPVIQTISVVTRDTP